MEKIESGKVKPVDSRVLVKVIRQEAKTASGIILTVDAPEKTDFAKVLAVGPSVENCEAGETVLFDKFAGLPFGDDLLMLEDSDVLAVYED